MTTIPQLPSATQVGPQDLLPLSQAGLLYSVSVATLTAGLQPAISVAPDTVLGRVSTGTGGPEPVALGMGLVLQSGALEANGGDHASFPGQTALTISDDVIVNASGVPGRLPISALRGLFTAGPGVAIDPSGVISVTVAGIAGPTGPQGAAGPTGPQGPAGPQGGVGAGLSAPNAANGASTIGTTDYVAIWQNGTNAWIPYGQLIGGQTIDQLPAAGPAADSDELLVAQGGNTLASQSFAAVWTYLAGKLPTLRQGVVELTGNTVLDGTAHNGRILVASQALALSANFMTMGSGFVCDLVNLASGPVTMGTGIVSGSGAVVLPAGTSARLYGLTYSGGSIVWWSGVATNTPAITVAAIAAPAPGVAFSVSGGVMNDAPTALDYSTNGGSTWQSASSPVITASAYSFTAAGLAAGTYTVQVRDHTNQAVLGVSNAFTIAAPAVSINAVAGSASVGVPIAISGAVTPVGAAVSVGLSASASTAPTTLTAAAVSNGSWSASVTPAGSGTVYAWAIETGEAGVQAVSGPIAVTTATLTLSAPATGTPTQAFSVSGTVSPGTDPVNVQLASSNEVVPSGGWMAATVADGNFTASVTPASAGTFYVWAEDTTSGLSAVSGAVSVAAAPTVALTINTPSPTTYAHGSGTIGLNGGISPAQAVSVQIALSTSSSAAPTSGWQATSTINNNSLWAIYAAVPATVGTYYVWAQTTSGGGTTVSSFALTIT